MRDGQKILSITNLYLFLPEDFSGGIVEALEIMAKLYRESGQSLPPPDGNYFAEAPTSRDVWQMALENGLDNTLTGGVIGNIILSEYLEKNKDYVAL